MTFRARFSAYWFPRLDLLLSRPGFKKELIMRKLLLLSSLCLASASLAVVKAPEPKEPEPKGPVIPPFTKTATGKLIVHEWGTFTNFAGSDGVYLDYRPLVD